MARCVGHSRELSKDAYKLLVLGSSDITFTDTGEAGTVPAKIKAELRRRFPATTWDLDSALLYPTERMAEFAASHIDRFQPDAIFLSMGTNTFVERSVVHSLRRRLPILYPIASRLSRTAKAIGGGRAEGSPGPWGVLFRAPRSLGRLVLGTAPLIDPEVALKATAETFEMLAGRGLPVAVRLAEGNVQQSEQRASAQLMTARYNDAVREMCRRSGFTAFRLSEEMGSGYSRTPDGLHTDEATRAYEASRAADVIAAGLGLISGAAQRLNGGIEPGAF